MTKCKKIGITCVILLITGLIAIIIIPLLNKPINSLITISGLSNEAASNSYILAATGQNYYELQGNNNFSELFDFDQWQESDKPDGEPVLILRFAEQFILEIYSNGYAAAHNSYASGDEKSDAFYSIPQNTADNLIAYVEQFGKPHQFGDGSISASTFNY